MASNKMRISHTRRKNKSYRPKKQEEAHEKAQLTAANFFLSNDKNIVFTSFKAIPKQPPASMGSHQLQETLLPAPPAPITNFPNAKPPETPPTISTESPPIDTPSLSPPSSQPGPEAEADLPPQFVAPPFARTCRQLLIASFKKTKTHNQPAQPKSKQKKAKAQPKHLGLLLIMPF